MNEGQFTVNLDMKIKNTYKRALSHFELKNFEEVVKDTTAVIQYDATMVQPRALMGRALKILNDHKKAEEQLTTAVILDENQAALYIGKCGEFSL